MDAFLSDFWTAFAVFLIMLGVVTLVMGYRALTRPLSNYHSPRLRDNLRKVPK